MLRRILFFLISSSLIIACNTGCAPTVAAIATHEVGTSIAEERSMGEILDDKAIMIKIKNKYGQRNLNNLFARISVHVQEGRVLLTGSVPDQQFSNEATELAWQVKGVKEVINELEVADKDMTTRATDSFIANHIRGKLLLEKDLKSVNYSVDVNNGIVYLIGVAQSLEELDRTVGIASQVKGVKKVISHVTLRDDPRRTKR